MAVAPEGSGTATGGHGDLGPHTRAKLRATLTGSIFAMSVLAYLGDHETTLTKAVLTVVGTGLVIFFGEAYAGLFSMALASVRALPAAEVRHELSACSMAAAPGVLAGAFLLIADVLGTRRADRHRRRPVVGGPDVGGRQRGRSPGLTPIAPVPCRLGGRVGRARRRDHRAQGPAPLTPNDRHQGRVTQPPVTTPGSVGQLNLSSSES